jgi:hypothetical protein
MAIMSGITKKPGSELSRLREELAADVMGTSDEEIFAEVRDRGVDPEAAATRVASVLQRAVLDSGKEKMAAARESLQKQKAAEDTREPVDIAKARALLEKAATSDANLQQRLTLAARNGDSLPDGDVQSLVDDLLELGILTDEAE